MYKLCCIGIYASSFNATVLLYVCILTPRFNKRYLLHYFLDVFFFSIFELTNI